MSIKNIQDSLNTVNNISADLKQTDTSKGNISSNSGKIDDLSTKLGNSIKLNNYFLIKHLN